MEVIESVLNIKSWSPEDRPRQKLVLKGKSSLTDAELVAVLLGSGTRKLSDVDVAKRMLQSAGNSLHELARLSVTDLIKLKGVGEAKAVTVVAALELGRRRKYLEAHERPQIKCSNDAFELLKPELLDIAHEEFWIVSVNRANRVIRKHLISQGGVSSTIADPKIIFKAAVDDLASGIILAHNHPSGTAYASQADIELTKRLLECGKLLEIKILDHLIFAGQRYVSFADDGML